MGKLILCSGVRTKRPYIFLSSGIRIYSIEELCYYIYNHVYLIEEEMFTDSLFDWIGNDLMLEERVAKLKVLKEQKADLKTIVTVVLCSSDYYTESEIKALIRILDKIIDMPLIKRYFIRANEFLKDGQFFDALNEYRHMLCLEEASELTPEEYGDVLHNMAVATAHIKGLEEATELFGQAYERNHREESLRQFLYAFKLSGGNISEKLKEYQLDDTFGKEILDYLAQAEHESDNNEEFYAIKNLKQCKEDGKIKEYNMMSDKIIDEWKTSIRRIYMT
jgi:tetratricopeptide (TPR) repeat protein